MLRLMTISLVTSTTIRWYHVASTHSAIHQRIAAAAAAALTCLVCANKPRERTLADRMLANLQRPRHGKDEKP